MRMRDLRYILLLLALATSCFKTPTQHQRDQAEALRPAEVLPTPAVAQRPLRIFKVRAFADQDYLAQTPRAAARIEAQLDRASKVLRAQFGVALELESMRPWTRTDRKTGLAAALEELRAADPAQGIDWVIGFVSSLQVYSASQEELGMAAVFGRHLILRGMISLEEAKRFEAELDKLSIDEREALLRERRLHRETAVLLHEWAHTLGAFHEGSGAHLLSPVYSNSQASFSPETARVIELGLLWRNLGDAASRALWAKGYREEVERSTEVADERTRAQALAVGRELLEGRAAQSPAPVSPASNSDAACFKSYQEAPRGDEALARCSAAALEPGARPQLLLILGQLKLARDDPEGALLVLSRAEAGLLAQPASADDWTALAQLYGRAQSCSAAEGAAARAPGILAAAVVIADCGRLRSWTALPRAESGVPMQAEPRYIAAVLAALGEADAQHAERAAAAAAALAREYPSAGGAALITCYLTTRTRPLPQGRKKCAAAAQAAPNAVYPRYVLGRLAAISGRLEEAQRSLEQALSLDDSSGEVWLSLGAVLARRGSTSALADLKERYRNRFGVELRLGQ